MIKKYLSCLSLLLSLSLAGAAHADELADAKALFAKKAYPQALQLYTKLGNAGNAEAQPDPGQWVLLAATGLLAAAVAAIGVMSPMLAL